MYAKENDSGITTITIEKEYSIMKNTIAHDVKVKVAATFVNNPALSVKDIAKEFKLSESSVRKFRQSFLEKAAEILLLQIAGSNDLTSDIVDKPTIQITKPSKRDTEDKRGYQGRNGRMAILNDAFAKYGLDGDRDELMINVNNFCKAAGIKEMTKVQFNYFHYVFRNKAGN